jgi:hypothetical protein
MIDMSDMVVVNGTNRHLVEMLEDCSKGAVMLKERIAAASGDDRQGSTCQNNSIWGTPDWLFCRDGKWRPVESGTFPLADGIPGRVGLLRGYGNAIVPQVAAEFITAFMEVE